MSDSRPAMLPCCPSAICVCLAGEELVKEHSGAGMALVSVVTSQETWGSMDR